MTTKRIVIFSIIIVLTFFAFVIGKRIISNQDRHKADIYLLSGDYNNAIVYYDKLISTHPDKGELYYYRGDAYNYNGDYEKAMIDYKKSLELSPFDSLQKILRIALVAKRLDDFKTEELYLLQLLNLSRNKVLHKNEFWASNYHLGQLEFKKKNYRRSIEYYNIAQQISPNNYNLYHRANAYSALGLIDSARQDFNASIQFVKKDFIEKFPNSSLAKCDTCGFLFGSKEYELLTEPNGESTLNTIINALETHSKKSKTQRLNDKLKSGKENNR